jgi:GNAT acetyltransferase
LTEINASERIDMAAADRTLLRLHVEAVWGVRLPALVRNDVELLQESPLPSWKLCAADISDERVHIWRPDIYVAEREMLRLRVHNALAFPPVIAPIPSVSREVALTLVTTPRLNVDMAHTIARPLTSQDQSLIETFHPGAFDDYLHPERQPLIGVVISGRLLSLAHSSRRTQEACELAIDTVPEARRKGYALAATIVWAHTVLRDGLIPIYSALAENTASLRLAAAAGYRPFARVATFEG